MKETYSKIKWAYQRVVRGYDDRLNWGLDGYLMENIVPGLKEFCFDYQVSPQAKLNPERTTIFQETLRLIDRAEVDESWDNKEVNALFKFVGENVGWYWD